MESTLDESVLKTIWRDIVTIARNLRAVLIPVNWKFKANEGALRNWDLWGPLIFMLVLAIVLSAGEKNASQVFSLVFAEVGLGALVLTLNVILLGGDIVFFQAICLLGYCMFPVDIAAIVCSFVHIRAVRWTVLSLCIVWAALATIPFLGGAVPDTRRALAVYPVLLLYISLGWIALIKN